MSIYNYTVEFEENGAWRIEPNWARPFHDGKTLDESLDFGQIILFGVARKEPYKPFTPIRISIYEVQSMNTDVHCMTDAERASFRVDTVYRLVSDSKVEQKCFAYKDGEDRYNHTIGTIEYTKLLEREICDNCTFTRYLSREYAVTGDETPVKFDLWIGGSPSDISLSVYEGKLYNDFNELFNLNGIYWSPLKINSKILFIPATVSVKSGYVGNVSGKLSMKIIAPDGKEYDSSISATQLGTYLIQYIHKGSHQVSNDPAYQYHKAIWQFELGIVDFDIPSKTKFSIPDVINRILSICPTRREGIETQKYILDPTVAEKYSEIEAPEFHITRSTLWEALSQVGGYIHAIPRLEYPNVITFDELGGAYEYIPPETLRCVAYSAQRGIDETCDAIDSTVENFLCTEDLGQGAITEPCFDGWKSIRCEEGQFVLSNDNALILTNHPIYRVIKVEVAKAHSGSIAQGGWQYIGDITPYIFEAAEYKTLTSYDGAYPYSRSFALCYSQGDNKITDLQFKQEVISFIGELTNRNPAIKNIIERIGGTCPALYSELAFRVTYIPMTSARVKQLKPYAASSETGNNTLLYNQSANTVESASYGENLKGTIARLGNTDEQRTYLFEHYADLPKVGQLWDSKYISRVECEYQKHYIKATVTLTENFNRLAQYLGLHTNYRLYDVSEKQSEERQINYSERVIIGNNAETDISLSCIKAGGVELFRKTLLGHSGLIPVGNAVLTLKDSLQNKIKTVVMLPCTSTGLGNSVAFSWKFEDNYGAGYKSSHSTKFKRIQEIVPYGDVYGEFHYMQASLFNGLPYMSTKNQATPHELPQFDGSAIQYEGLFDFGDYPLVVQKDSREQINMTYQLHFMSNRRSIVIGSGLGQYNALVSPDPLETELYFSEKRLNVFRPIFHKDETGRKDFTVNRSGKRITLNVPTPPEGTKSWALVGVRRDKDGNIKSKQLIIGENIDGKVKPVYFNFVSNKQ